MCGFDHRRHPDRTLGCFGFFRLENPTFSRWFLKKFFECWRLKKVSWSWSWFFNFAGYGLSNLMAAYWLIFGHLYMYERTAYSCWCYLQVLHSIQPTQYISIQMFARSFHGSCGFSLWYMYINRLFFYVYIFPYTWSIHYTWSNAIYPERENEI